MLIKYHTTVPYNVKIYYVHVLKFCLATNLILTCKELDDAMPVFVPHKPTFASILLNSTTVNHCTKGDGVCYEAIYSFIFLQKSIGYSHILEEMKSMAGS